MTRSSGRSPDGRPRLPRPGAIDRHIGARIRQRREQLGLSQQELAELVGVSVPTLGRYEEGSLRIGAARLGAVSKALKTTIPYFFEDVPPLDEYDTEARAAQAQEVHTKDQIVKDQIVSNETLEIVRL